MYSRHVSIIKFVSPKSRLINDISVFCLYLHCNRNWLRVKVLQQTADHELHLYSGVKEQSRPIAQVMIISLSSQPVDQEDRRPVPATDVGLCPIVVNLFQCLGPAS